MHHPTILLTVALWFGASTNAAGTQPSALGEALMEHGGLSVRDIEKTERKPVVTEISVDDKRREVTMLGVVRVNVPEPFFREQVQRILTSPHSATIKQVGLFSDPPSPEDMASLVLPQSDIEDLRKCKVGACKVKLPARAIEHFETLDWSGPDPGDRINEWVRGAAANYVKNYRELGNAALVVYDDKPNQQSAAEGFLKLLDQPPSLKDYFPAVQRYLRDYPSSAPAGVSDFVYWSLEEQGLKPTLLITHVQTFELPEGEDPRSISIFKLLYASHYFTSRLQQIGVFETEPEEGPPGIYLALLDRAQFDDRLAGPQRFMLKRGMKSYMERRLAGLRDRLLEEFH